MWEYRCLDCVNPVSLVQGLVWVYIPAMSLLSVLAVILLVGVTTKSLAGCRGRAPSLLRDCHHPVGRQGLLPSCCSRSPKFNQAPFPLSICPVLKEVMTEASQACAVTVNPHTEAAQGHLPFSVVFIPDLVQGCGVMGLGAQVLCLQELRCYAATGDLGCLCGRPLPGCVRPDSAPSCSVG